MQAAAMQAQLAAQARCIGVASRTLRNKRIYKVARQHARIVAAAAAEPDVAEAQAAEAAEGAPAAEQQQQRDSGKRRNNQRNKRTLGPARTLGTADVEEGKWYDGVVVSVMEFGAFVNIGANTDGLLHISQISTGFVKKVSDSIKVGDDVKVRVMNVDTEKGKFAVTLIDPEAAPAAEQMGDDADGPRERPRQARREKAPRQRREPRKSPVKAGDTVTNTVVSVSPFGAFIDVGGGVTGLLHETEVVLPEGVSDWKDVVREGQEVTVHVVNVQGGKIQLSMRSPEEAKAERDFMATGLKSVVEAPAGAGLLGLKLAGLGISASQFKTKTREPAEAAAAAAPAEPEVAAPEPAAPAEPEVAAPEPAVPAEPEVAAPEPVAAAAAPAEPEVAAPAKEEAKPAAGGISAALVKELRDASGAGMMDCKKALAECGGDVEKAKEFLRKKGLASADKKAGRVAAEGMVWSYIHAGSRLGVLLEMNCETDFVARGDKFQELVNDMAMQIAACQDVTVVSVEDVPAELLERERAIEMEKEDILSKPEAIRPKIVQGRVEKIAKTMALLEQPFVKDTNKTVAEIVKEAVAAIGENIQIRRFSKFNLGEGIEKGTADLAADVEAQTKAIQEKASEKKEEAPAQEAAPAAEAKPAVAISASAVKELRNKTGAGMMDCKKALGECGGDVQAATEFLRKKGLASADKKAGRVAAEGAIGAYIHAGSRLGVLVEMNCETDFVARGDKFRELVNDMAMQIAACQDVTVVSVEDVPADVLERERAIEMEKEDILSKPEAIRPKIVQGRVDKIAKEMALLEQSFVKDTNKTVAEHIKAQIAAIGENIQVRRFERFVLGEGIEKKVTDFAAEVAAQTGGV